MSTYVRPHIDLVTFRDAAGHAIDYGNRWVDGPPEDSYSIEENLERFLPLHAVTTALIGYLTTKYAVVIEEGPHLIEGLANAPKPSEVLQAVRLTPLAEGCAPMVFLMTDLPGVRLFAGTLFSTAYPSCGCNACDENWPDVATELEWQTQSIAGGGFTEGVSEPRRPKWSFDPGHGFVQGMGQTINYRLRAIDGSGENSGASRADGVPAAVLNRARATLDDLAALSPEGNWLPWPLK